MNRFNVGRGSFSECNDTSIDREELQTQEFDYELKDQRDIITSSVSLVIEKSLKSVHLWEYWYEDSEITLYTHDYHEPGDHMSVVQG